MVCSDRCADSVLEILATQRRPRLIRARATHLLSLSPTLSFHSLHDGWLLVSVRFSSHQFALLLKGVATSLQSNHRSVQWVRSSIFTRSYRVFSVSRRNAVFHVVHSRVVASESLAL